MAGTRYLIVVRADLATKANAAASKPDTDPDGGDKAFTVPLSASGSAPAQAYWCSWWMNTATAAAIRQRLRDEGATAAEVTPIPAGGSPASNRFAVFDTADGWTPATVLDAVGLRVLPPAP